MDYHLDLFIRPLANKNILITDDEKTKKVLVEGRQKILKKLEQDPENKKYIDIADRFEKIIRKFITARNMNFHPQTNEVENILKFHGFNTIRVPGRVYTSNHYRKDTQILYHDCNYMNANVCINKDGELIYITNKSNIDKNLGLTEDIIKEIDFSFEKSFIKSLAPYVKPEHIYFIEGQDNFVADKMLLSYLGGIHCTCAEIPEEKNEQSESGK